MNTGGEVNNTDSLFITAPAYDYIRTSEHIPKFDVQK